MTSYLRLLAVVALFLAAAYSSAQPAAPQPAASGNAQATEVAVLRAQLETTKQFHDSYMTVTVSALGTAIAIVLALAAFSWFTSKSNYERDRAFLEEKVAALRRELDTLVQERTSQLQKELADSLDARQAGIQKAVEASTAPKITALSAKVEKVRSTALDLQIGNQLETAKRSVAAHLYDYAITEYCEAIRLHVERGSDSYMAGDIFDKIHAVLKMPDVKMSADNLTDAVGILEALPKEHRHLAEQLVQRLKQLVS